MKLVKIIQEYASLAITGIVIFIVGMMMCVTIKGVENWRDPSLWIEMGFNAILQIVIVITWLPEGKKRGAANETYNTNRTTANDKMTSAAAPENFKPLTEFCKIATEKNRLAWVSQKVLRYGINYGQWVSEDYKAQFELKVQKKVELIEKRSYQKVNEIKATETITNSQINLVYDTRDHTDQYATIKVSVKMALSIGMCVIGAFIAIDRVQFALTAFIKFLYWLLVACLSIFYSIRTGYKLITENKNDYYKRIIVFLSHFEEWNASSKTCVDTEKAPSTDALSNESGF